LVTIADQLAGTVGGRTRGLAPVTVARIRALAAATVSGDGDAIGEGEAIGEGDDTTTGEAWRGANWIV
jgi:hypothetical protein